MINKNLINLDEENIVHVNNILNIDVNVLKKYLDENNDINIVDLKCLLFGSSSNKSELAKELNVSR